MISQKESENLRGNFVIDGVAPITPHTLNDLRAIWRYIVAEVTRIVGSVSE